MKESGHWYHTDGRSCHELPNKSKPGTMRATTIRDARTLGLIPSITTQFNCLAKKQLEDWKMEQVALASRRLLIASPAQFAEADDDTWTEAAITEAFRQVEQAADAGELIHKGAELALQGLEYDEDEPVFLPQLQQTFPLKTFIGPICRFVAENEIRVTAMEVPVVNMDHGYAGRMDCGMRSKRGLGVLDFKTRKTKPGRAVTPYVTQPMQISAYHVGHYRSIPKAGDFVTGCNLYISTTEPGRVEACWYDAAQVGAEFDAFTHVCALWRHLNNYDPRQLAKAA